MTYGGTEPTSRSRPDIKTPAPSPTLPSTLSSGTKQSSKMSSHVLEPRIPILSSFGPDEKPAKPRSTLRGATKVSVGANFHGDGDWAHMKVVTFCDGLASGSVRA